MIEDKDGTTYAIRKGVHKLSIDVRFMISSSVHVHFVIISNEARV